MSFETGALIAMSVGIVGAAVLTAYAVWSKHSEDQDKTNHHHH